MNQVENYKDILETIFDREISFTNYGTTNNCIGALNRKDDYQVFKDNFIKRLKRLNNNFVKQPATLTEIVNTAKIIGHTKGYKWSGAYSELVALDYWSEFKNINDIKFPDRGNVNDFAESIARQNGQTEVDLDISFNLTTKKIYTDVKSLIPTHTELADNIIHRVEGLTKNKDFLIGVDDIFDVDYIHTKNDLTRELKSESLINGLVACINNEQCCYRYTLNSGANINFRIAYKGQERPTILTTMREMNPYKLALDYKYKILDYYNKLLIDKPSLITFVVNPWFNQELNSDSNFLEVFFRSLSRRVFMELVKDHNDMAALFPELTGCGLRISDIAAKITGIIFIVDRSIMKPYPDIYDTYIYLNPNANNQVLRRGDFDILTWSPKPDSPFIEDFHYDNY